MLSFSPAGSYDTGSGAQAVVTADFNNDHHLDLATANAYDNSVSVLLGDGLGGFSNEVRYSVGSWPSSVAVGDFDEDGNLDLATANQTSYDLSVLPGNGDGTFGAAKSVPAYGVPTSVAVGDFNADGKLDLGAASWGYGLFYYGFASIHAGDGNGNFEPPKVTTTWGSPFEYAVAADLNGDGADDFVVADDWNSVHVFLGDPSGYFQMSAVLDLGHQAQYVAVGDVNGDGFADIVTANNFADHAISVLLADGQGGYGAAQSYVSGTWSDSVVLGDFTGDGNVDIAFEQDNRASVLHGYGDGTFSDPTQSPLSVYVADAAAGDFNGDGWLDVATANYSTVSVLLNDQSWEDPPPSLSISDATVAEGNTGTTNATFTVTLSKATNVDVIVHYDTADGSALAGSDYTAKSGMATIPAGQTSRTFTVAVLGDRLVEPTETFSVNLSAPTNATIADAYGLGTILDDEPRIRINDVSASEGNSKQPKLFTFTISLSSAYDQAVTVSYSTANGTATAGSDYQSQAGTVTFAPGQTTKTITVAVIGDKQKEANETFFVNLSGANVGEITDNLGLGTILNDDGGRAKNRFSIFASAVDAAIDDWMSPGRKKRAW